MTPTAGFPATRSHRSANCTKTDSPLRNGGYFIEPEASLEAAERDAKMPLRDVPAYVGLKLGCRPSLATIYNWIDRGVRGEKLKVVMSQGTSRFAGVFDIVRFTTAVWLDEFLSRAGVSAGRQR